VLVRPIPLGDDDIARLARGTRRIGLGQLAHRLVDDDRQLVLDGVALDFDHLVPGHGPIADRSSLDDQRAILLEWKSRVAAAVAEGLSREETQARVNLKDRFPVDIGQEYMMDYIMGHNAGALWDQMTSKKG